MFFWNIGQKSERKMCWISHMHAVLILKEPVIMMSFRVCLWFILSWWSPCIISLPLSFSATLSGAVCIHDRLTHRFCQTLFWLGRCHLPNIRAQCCRTCSQRSSSRGPSLPWQQESNQSEALSAGTLSFHSILLITIKVNNLSLVLFLWHNGVISN